MRIGTRNGIADDIARRIRTRVKGLAGRQDTCNRPHGLSRQHGPCGIDGHLRLRRANAVVRNTIHISQNGCANTRDKRQAENQSKYLFHRRHFLVPKAFGCVQRLISGQSAFITRMAKLHPSG